MSVSVQGLQLVAAPGQRCKVADFATDVCGSLEKVSLCSGANILRKSSKGETTAGHNQP